MYLQPYNEPKGDYMVNVCKDVERTRVLFHTVITLGYHSLETHCLSSVRVLTLFHGQTVN
jgi:hypothetical protein